MTNPDPTTAQSTDSPAPQPVLSNTAIETSPGVFTAQN